MAEMKSPKDWPASNVEMRAIAGLVPYARNARTHSPEQVDQIAASMREFGWTNPILVDEGGTLIAGHGRILAAQKLGLTEAPVMTARGWTEAQRRAYVLADNKLALNAGWDMERLAVELNDLTGMGFDLGLTGFSETELAGMAGGTAGLTDPDAVPEPGARAVATLGDVWLLGGHRLVCGDCTDAKVAISAQASDAAMILTDPPYGIGYSYAEHDDGDNEENAQLVADAFSLGPAVKVWTPGLNNLARDIGRFGRSRTLVWFKKFAAAGNGLGGASTWEPILVCGYTPARRLKNDVIEIMTERETVGGVSLRKFHTCPKPVALYAALLEALTDPGQIIYEPFSGSGTTLMACEKTGRNCRAVELTPVYVDVAIKRWQDFTGKKATLEPTGQTFEDVADARYDWRKDGFESWEVWCAAKRKELEDARSQTAA